MNEMTTKQTDALGVLARDRFGGAEIEVMAGPLRVDGEDALVASMVTDEGDGCVFGWCGHHLAWHEVEGAEPDTVFAHLVWREIREERDGG